MSYVQRMQGPAYQIGRAHTIEAKRLHFAEIGKDAENFTRIAARRHGGRTEQNSRAKGIRKTPDELRAILLEEVQGVRSAHLAALEIAAKVLRVNLYEAEARVKMGKHLSRDVELLPLPALSRAALDAEIKRRQGLALEGERLGLKARRLVAEKSAVQILDLMQIEEGARNLEAVGCFVDALVEKYGKKIPVELAAYIARLEQEDFWGERKAREYALALSEFMDQIAEEYGKLKEPISPAYLAELEAYGVSSGGKLLENLEA